MKKDEKVARKREANDLQGCRRSSRKRWRLREEKELGLGKKGLRGRGHCNPSRGGSVFPGKSGRPSSKKEKDCGYAGSPMTRTGATKKGGTEEEEREY